MNTIERAFDYLARLPDLEGGFLRHLLLQAIDDPDLASNPALAEHLHLVPRVLQQLAPRLVRDMEEIGPTFEQWARDYVALSAAVVADVANGATRSDISHETLAKLSHIAFRDPRFLAKFLERIPASSFL